MSGIIKRVTEGLNCINTNKAWQEKKNLMDIILLAKDFQVFLIEST